MRFQCLPTNICFNNVSFKNVSLIEQCLFQHCLFLRQVKSWSHSKLSGQWRMRPRGGIIDMHHTLTYKDKYNNKDNDKTNTKTKTKTKTKIKAKKGGKRQYQRHRQKRRMRPKGGFIMHQPLTKLLFPKPKTF